MCLHLTLIYIVCMVSGCWVLTKITHTHTLPLKGFDSSLSNALPLSSASGCLDGLVGRGSQGVCMCVCVGGKQRVSCLVWWALKRTWPAEQKQLQNWITLPSLCHVRRNSAPCETPDLSVVTPNYHQQQPPTAPMAEWLARTDGPLWFNTQMQEGRDKMPIWCMRAGLNVKHDRKV